MRGTPSSASTFSHHHAEESRHDSARHDSSLRLTFHHNRFAFRRHQEVDRVRELESKSELNTDPWF